MSFDRVLGFSDVSKYACCRAFLNAEPFEITCTKTKFDALLDKHRAVIGYAVVEIMTVRFRRVLRPVAAADA